MNNRFGPYCFAIFLLVFTACTTAEKQPPNVLWIVGDDLGLELGAYGYGSVHTPNLDSLAENGLVYTKFFTSAPVCSPSRSSFITGQYPTVVNSHLHRTSTKLPLPEGVDLLPELFRRAGYYTFQHSANNPKTFGKFDYNFQTDFKYDGKRLEANIEDKPFFGQVQIHEPHRPFVKGTPVNGQDSLVIPAIYPETPLIRADWAQYIASVERMDELVGKTLAWLRETGKDKNTIIFFFGDHGRPHLWDKQFLYEGGLNTPLIVYNPLEGKTGMMDELVSGIDLAPTSLAVAGLPIPERMPGIDFLSDKENEYIYAQRDRSGDAVDEIRMVRDEKYKYITNGMPDRPLSYLGAYKRSFYPAYVEMKWMNEVGQLTPLQQKFYLAERAEEELYDLSIDPYESNNLINDPAHARVLERLRNKMQEMDQTYDQPELVESQEDLQKGIKGSKTYGRNRLKRYGLSPEATDEELRAYWYKTLVNRN